MNHLAEGGSAPIGAPSDMLEYDLGWGKRYDPHRDVVVFFPQLIHQVATTLHDREIPALEILDRKPKLEADVARSFSRLMATIKEYPTSEYRAVVTEWLKNEHNPEATNLLLAVIGRASLQFYVECIYARWEDKQDVNDKTSSLELALKDSVQACQSRGRLRQKIRRFWRRLFL